MRTAWLWSITAFVPLVGSEWRAPTVSRPLLSQPSRRGKARRAILQTLQIHRFKALLGAVNEDAQVVAIDAKVAANLVLVALFQEHLAKDAAVAFGQIVKDLAHFLFHLPGRHGTEYVDCRVGNLVGCLVFKRASAGRSAVLLKQNIVADRIDEGTEPLRLANAFRAAQDREEACKRFLANIFDGLWTTQADTQLQLNQFAEIRNKVFLRAEVAGAKTLQVRRIEGLKLHGLASRNTRVVNILALK